MNFKNQFVKNTGFVTLSKIIGNIFSYLIIILISRHLGAQGLGQYSFIFSFVGLFFIFSDWGLSYLLIKDISKDFSLVNKYVSNILTLKTLLTIISFIIYVVTIFFLKKNEIIISLILVGVIQLIRIVHHVSFAILRVKNEGKFIAFIQFLERFIALVGAVIVLPLTQNLTWFIAVLLFSNAINFIGTFVYSLKYYKFSFSLDWKFLFSLIKKSYPFLLVAVFTLVYVQMDTIMLSFMKGDVVVGWYNAGYKLINVFNVVPAMLLMFGFPLFSKLFAKNKKRLRMLFENIMYYSMIFLLPIVIGVFFVGSRIINMIYGFNSIESIIAFKILIVAEIFVFLTTIKGQLIASADKQVVFAKIAGLGALLNIILNFLLIPKYSLYGAGIATLATYVVMFILMTFYIKRKIITYSLLKPLLIPLVASVLMGGLLYFIVDLHLLILIPLSCAFYAFVIFLAEKMKSRPHRVSF